jgi:hypothetical protein
VSAVGHFLEQHGIPTAGISLVRENTAAMRPPRALWVPFPLGRPFGTPHAPDFQRDVLRALLRLFEWPSGPVLEDFPADAPAGPDGAESDTLVCPVSFPAPAAEKPSEWRARLAEEHAALAPWYALAEQEGRAASGVSGLGIQAAMDLLATFVTGNGALPDGQAEPARALRNAAEDLRGWYAAALTAQPGPKPGPAVLADWFWAETGAGALLLAAYPICLHHYDPLIRRIGETQWLPRAQRHLLPGD